MDAITWLELHIEHLRMNKRRVETDWAKIEKAGKKTRKKEASNTFIDRTMVPRIYQSN